MLRELLTTNKGPGVYEVLLGPFLGRVVVIDQQVHSVEAGPFAGLDALHRLLLSPGRPVRKGATETATRVAPPLGSVTELLRDFDVFASDLQRQSTRVGGFSRLWALRFLALKAVLQGLPDDVKRVVRLMDGTRDVCTLIAESPLPPLLTLRVVERLLQRGALERADLHSEDDVDAGDSPPAADHSWLQERASRPPEPAPPPTQVLLLDKRRRPKPEPLRPALAITNDPAPLAPRPQQLSAWLGPENEFFADHQPQGFDGTSAATWAPWTLVVFVIAGAVVGAAVALALS